MRGLVAEFDNERVSGVEPITMQFLDFGPGGKAA
jgi:hypothetical protein